MDVALYARVSTSQQQHAGTIESQRRALKQYMQHHGWSLLPEHAYRDDGVSGARLERPALDRLRDAAQRGAFDTVVSLSPDRVARNDAQPWLRIEECAKMHAPLLFLQHPFGDSPQGTRLTQMHGMIAEYERAQIAERTRRGRLEQARHGAFRPWASTCYGYRSLPKRHGCAPQVMLDPVEAAVVRDIDRALVEKQRSGRQSTTRLHTATTPTPTGKNSVWQPATGRASLPNRPYAGQARDHDRQPVLPQDRKTEEHRRQSRKTGRSSRAERAWVWSDAPAMLSVELFDKAPLQRQRNAATARKLSQPASRRYGLRTLVKCGECGLGMVCIRQRSVGQQYAYLYSECQGHSPRSGGRTARGTAKLVRAERLDAVVWHALWQLLHNPRVLPPRHQTWTEAKPPPLSGLEAQHAPVVQRRQRIERQDHRLLDASQAELINLPARHTRRQTLAVEWHQLAQERHQWAQTRHQSLHGQQVMDKTETVRQ